MLEDGTIAIFDDLVTEQMIGEIFLSVHQPVYKFGQKSNPGDTFGFWIANISDEVLANVAPLRGLWEAVDAEVGRGDLAIERMYVNAYSFGDCPTVHVDHDEPGRFTALYYANPEWSANWSGETVFYTDARDEIVRSVYPRPGRIAVFDARIPHVAREPNRICPFVRYTVAIKMVTRAVLEEEAARVR